MRVLCGYSGGILDAKIRYDWQTSYFSAYEYLKVDYFSKKSMK